jgi:hypothetical protein
LDVECIKVAGREIIEEAIRKMERCIAVEPVLRILNARVVYRVEMTESFRLRSNIRCLVNYDGTIQD